jgi:hypothetical protein
VLDDVAMALLGLLDPGFFDEATRNAVIGAF